LEIASHGELADAGRRAADVTSTGPEHADLAEVEEEIYGETGSPSDYEEDHFIPLELVCSADWARMGTNGTDREIPLTASETENPAEAGLT
jgi:hypothetical protein